MCPARCRVSCLVPLEESQTGLAAKKNAAARGANELVGIGLPARRSHAKAFTTMVRRREAALCLAICFPQHVCSLPHEIQNAFNKMSKYACPGAAPLLVGIAANNGQVRDYARWVQQLPGSPTICEIGFNCGHSTATFLEANPRSRVINFDMTDLKNFPWGHKAKGWFKREYGNRFVLVEGDSSVTVPAFFACNPSVRCDLAVVDGAHDYVHPLLDIVALVQASKCNASVIADDLCDPASCKAHKPHSPRKGSNHGGVLGPTQAWHEAHVHGYITEYEAHYGESVDRGWGIARVLCTDGAVKPARPAYSTDPIDVVFSPNVNNATAIEVDRRNREAAKRLWETPLPADSRAAQSTPPDCATLRMRNG